MQTANNKTASTCFKDLQAPRLNWYRRSAAIMLILTATLSAKATGWELTDSSTGQTAIPAIGFTSGDDQWDNVLWNTAIYSDLDATVDSSGVSVTGSANVYAAAEATGYGPGYANLVASVYKWASADWEWTGAPGQSSSVGVQIVLDLEGQVEAHGYLGSSTTTIESRGSASGRGVFRENGEFTLGGLQTEQAFATGSATTDDGELLDLDGDYGGTADVSGSVLLNNSANEYSVTAFYSISIDANLNLTAGVAAFDLLAYPRVECSIMMDSEDSEALNDFTEAESEIEGTASINLSF